MLSNDMGVLEELVETLEDGREGFKQAAEVQRAHDTVREFRDRFDD